MGWEGQLSSGQAATGGKSWQFASLQQSVKAKEIPVKGGPLAFTLYFLGKGFGAYLYP